MRIQYSDVLLKFLRLRKFADWRIVCSLMFMIAASACGGGGRLHNITNGGPPLSGNTNVTVVLSSAANDQLTTFDVGFSTITLTDQAGKTVSLSASQQPFESMHLNGNIEPFFSASIPQDIYTAVSATTNGESFVCDTLIPSGQPNAGGLASSQFDSNANVTINLASPLLVHGNNMTLLLSMDVSKSVSLGTCWTPNGPSTPTVTPIFELTPIIFSSQPTNAGNGKVVAMDGMITAIDAANSNFTFSIPGGTGGTRTLQVKYDTNTVLQGISDFASTAASTFADIDGAIQQDGSHLATRIAVEDPTALNVLIGPVLQVSSQAASLQMNARLEQGPLLTTLVGTPGYLGEPSLKFGNATFQISQQFKNLSDLPFVPTFTAANIVPGQNIYVGTPIIKTLPPTANTVTLIPQTVDGTVVSSSTNGNFSVYTVTLAPYDLFSVLAVQPGLPSLIKNPNEIEVYTDNNTQFVNGQTVFNGNTLRFNGLVFNDNGTLRMDCNQVSAGVAE
jgi:hypothetical protein